MRREEKVINSHLIFLRVLVYSSGVNLSTFESTSKAISEAYLGPTTTLMKSCLINSKFTFSSDILALDLAIVSIFFSYFSYLSFLYHLHVFDLLVQPFN